VKASQRSGLRWEPVKQHPILAHLHTARSLGHSPRRPVYTEYLSTPIARTECRSCGARLAAAGTLITISAMLAYPCPGGPAALQEVA
jgi:hypothetical protein